MKRAQLGRFVVYDEDACGEAIAIVFRWRHGLWFRQSQIEETVQPHECKDLVNLPTQLVNR